MDKEKIENVENNEDVKDNTKQDDKVVFSPEQQKVLEKILSDRLAKNDEKHRKETLEMLKEAEKAKEEAVRLAEEEKAKEVERSKMSEIELMRNDMKEMQDAYNKMKAEKEYQERFTNTRKVVREKGLDLSDSLITTLMTDDEETTIKNIDSLVDYTDLVRQNAYAEATKGVTPKATPQKEQPKADPFKDLMNKYK